MRDPSWLADHLIPETGLAMLWGAPNVGKSFVALDLACSVVAGNDWLNRTTKRGSVIYVAGEGVSSFKKRLHAWMRWNSVAADDLENLLFINRPVQLHEGVASFIRTVRAYEPALVIVDTLAASTLGIEEDKTIGVAPVIKSLLEIRKELECAVLAVHHSGWQSDHERGSSSLRGVFDTSMKLEKTGARGKLTCEKQRDAEHFRSIALRFHEVTWRTPKGKQLGSLVPCAV